MPTEPTDEQPPIKKSGPPRTGKYPARDWRMKGTPKGPKWAASNRWYRAFFAAYKRHGVIAVAADKAGVSLGTVKNRRRDDPAFAAKFDECDEWFTDYMKSEVYRRALEGDERFEIDKKTGEVVSLGKKPSELLLMFSMKQRDKTFVDAHKPDDKQGAAQVLQVLVGILEQGKALGTPSAPALPSYDDFRQVIDVTPAETSEQKVARLEAELAAAKAEVRPPDADA